jgi:hypothetical protein
LTRVGAGAFDEEVRRKEDRRMGATGETRWWRCVLVRACAGGGVF